MKGNKKAMLNIDTLSIWMALISMIILLAVYSILSLLMTGDSVEKTEETFIELDGQYTLINLLRTPVVTDEDMRSRIIAETEKQGTLKKDMIEPLINNIYKDEIKYGELLDLYLLEENADAKAILRHIFHSNVDDIMDTTMTKENIRAWNLRVEYSDGTESICGDKDCFIWRESKPPNIDVHTLEIPSKKRGTMIELSILLGREDSGSSLLTMLVGLI